MANHGKYSNDDLAKILDKLLDGIIIVGKGGQIRYANIAAAKLFDKNTQELVGEEFGYVIIPQKVQDIQIVQEQKILFVQMLASALEWNGEDASLISLRDVSDLKKGELDLQVQRLKLEQSNLELSQYASMASHDLREPVRKILTFSMTLLEKYAGHLPTEPYKMIEKVHNSANRLKTLIDGVSKFSGIRKTALSTAPVDLNQTILQIIEDIEILIIEKKAIVKIDNLPIVNGDANLLYQLFLNLITNSIKYSRPGVSPIVDISGKLVNGVVIIYIQDNGIGFENKYAKKIFEPFQRLLTDGYEGTGIGLAICKKVVDTHNGKISAQSIPDIGTRFMIEFPQVSKKPE